MPSGYLSLVLTLGVIFALGWLVWLLSPILTPFVAAAILAYLCDPMVDALERFHLSRGLGSALVMLALALVAATLLFVLIPVLSHEFGLLAAQAPQTLAWVQDSLLPWLNDHLGLQLQFNAEALRRELLSQVGSGAAQAWLPRLGNGSLAILAFFANLALVPVVMFYLLRDWDRLVAWIETNLPRAWHDTVTGYFRELDTVLGEFLRGQLAVILIMAAYYSVGLALTGLHFALAIGILAGVLVFIPYLGATMGVILATLMGATQYGSWTGLLPVWGVFLIGQLIEAYAVTPKLVGERVGLHPVGVIFSLMAFGQVFGFFGVLLAIPLASSTLVAVRRGLAWYKASRFY